MRWRFYCSVDWSVYCCCHSKSPVFDVIARSDLWWFPPRGEYGAADWFEPVGRFALRERLSFSLKRFMLSSPVRSGIKGNRAGGSRGGGGVPRPEILT
jgi:hypothetical protein